MTTQSLPPAFDVSRETTERLNTYAALLQKWNPAINLVSAATLPNLWERHFVDSAQVFDLAPERAVRWADLGSGGGFPGMVVAILAHEKRPTLKVTCVESDLRKATFLRTVARETGVNAEVISSRIEDLDPLEADVLSARALAPLTVLLGFAARHLAPGGVAIFPKGAGHSDETAKALETWRFEADTYPSITSPTATILRIGDIRRV